MRILDHSETLVYYDGSQLFIARDQLGTNYVCLLFEEGSEVDKYICVPSSGGRINSLITGDMDLREVYDNPETDDLYIVETRDGELFSLQAKKISAKDVPEDWFPEQGLFLKIPKPADIEVVEESIKRQRAIIQYRLNPPESLNEPKITAEHLSQAVKLIQRIIKYAYKRSLLNLDERLRQNVSEAKNYELEVFALSSGSFTIQMQSSAPADLLGYVYISRAMEILDSISEQIDDPSEAVNRVAKIGGHFASTYKDLVKFIMETETPIEYEWTMPEKKKSSRYRISIQQAKPVYEEMSKRVKIGIEEITIKGRLSKVDEKYKTWRLTSEKENKEYTGASDIDLAGLIIETQSYEFVCEERLEEEKGTGKEYTRLYLKSFVQLNS